MRRRQFRERGTAAKGKGGKGRPTSAVEDGTGATKGGGRPNHSGECSNARRIESTQGQNRTAGNTFDGIANQKGRRNGGSGRDENGREKTIQNPHINKNDEMAKKTTITEFNVSSF